MPDSASQFLVFITFLSKEFLPLTLYLHFSSSLLLLIEGFYTSLPLMARPQRPYLIPPTKEIKKKKKKKQVNQNHLTLLKWGWSAPPKIAVNIDMLLKRAMPISQQVRNNGLQLNLEELRNCLCGWRKNPQIVKSTKDSVSRSLPSLVAKVLTIIAGTSYAFWGVLQPSVEDKVGLM